MGTYVVTGASSGIGAAVRSRLETDRHVVIGVDLEGSDIDADLGTEAGRELAAEEIRRRSPEALEGVVPCAGVAGLTGVDPATLVSVNFFGATGLVTRLRPLMAASEGAGVVMISSNSVTCQPGWPAELAALCLAGDEGAAREAAAAFDAVHLYPASKAAVADWVRRESVLPEWIGAGVRLNAVAPGMIATPMTDRLREDPELGAFADAYPSALGRPGRPEEVAEVVAFLLSGRSSLLVGSVVLADGGTDALLNPHYR